MRTLWTWIVDRFRERSTKQMLSVLIGTLVLIGVLPDESGEAVTGLVEEGQDIYHEGRDSVEVTIEEGRELYEEGRTAVEDAVDTGRYFYARILAWLMAIGSFFGGLFTRDAKGGVEYEERMAEARYRMVQDGIPKDRAEAYTRL